MRLNTQNCILCGELHGANLRVEGYEICACCEHRLVAGRLAPSKALPGMRRLAVKSCLLSE